MHEMAITQSLIELVVEEARKSGASKIINIDIVIGEMSGIVDHCVQFNFEYLSKDTPAEGAKLNFHTMPMQAHCLDCNHDFAPSGFVWQCPECQSPKLKITQGSELYIKSIEVE